MTSVAEDQFAFWNGAVGQLWAARQAHLDAVMAPVAEAALARAAVRPGECVVDIGCGCGATAIELARRAAPAGRVLGIDLSAPMLARAAARRPPGLPLDLVQGDAAAHPFPQAGFDLLFSRFGVMFFAEPARAFAHLRGALRLVFACYRAARENPWMTVPLQAAYEHVPPLPETGPEEPGPFAFAQAERVRRILGEAGFRAIALEPVDLDYDIAAGKGLDAAVEAALEIGPTRRAVADQPPAVRSAVAASVRRVLAPYQRGQAVPLPAALWLVSAESP